MDSNLCHRCLLVVAFLSGSGSAGGQQGVPIAIDTLPKPPEKIEKLLKLGSVTFEAGEGASATAGDQNRSPVRSSLSAVTHYKLSYSYNSRTRWIVREQNGRRQLKITVRYSSIKLMPKHIVWFRKQPKTDGFWDNRLVLHELDHVKISSDPWLTNRFKEMLLQSAVIETEIDSGVRVSDSMVDRLVDQHAKEQFETISELLGIRYRELDRITRHGLDPLPESSALFELLRDK